MVPAMLKLGFLASHGGSAMRAIVAACRAGTLAAEPRLVIGNNADAPALAFARESGIPAHHISRRQTDDPDAAMAEALAASGVELVVLSGYMRKLGPAVLARYPRRILNIHPALLPRYGGQGMYGSRVHEAVAASGDAVSGITIHLVDDEYDHGDIVAQREVKLEPGDTASEIEARVRAAEPQFFVETLRRIADGELRLP
jgi:phosphoribosylglycinamide formyltransferase-1